MSDLSPKGAPMSRPLTRLAPLCIAAALLALPCAANARIAGSGHLTAASGAATYYVDQSSPSCSTSGPGTPEAPYCTISSALAAHHGSGTTIVVLPGTYHEQVTVPASGVSGSPIVLQGQASPGQPVVVDG